MVGWLAPPDLGTNTWVPEEPRKSKKPVPGVKVGVLPKVTSPTTLTSLLPKFKLPYGPAPPSEIELKKWAREDPRLKVPWFKIRLPAFRLLVTIVVPPVPYCLIWG